MVLHDRGAAASGWHSKAAGPRLVVTTPRRLAGRSPCRQPGSRPPPLRPPSPHPTPRLRAPAEDSPLRYGLRLRAATQLCGAAASIQGAAVHREIFSSSPSVPPAARDVSGRFTCHVHHPLASVSSPSGRAWRVPMPACLVPCRRDPRTPRRRPGHARRRARPGVGSSWGSTAGVQNPRGRGRRGPPALPRT